MGTSFVLKYILNNNSVNLVIIIALMSHIVIEIIKIVFRNDLLFLGSFAKYDVDC